MARSCPKCERPVPEEAGSCGACGAMMQDDPGAGLESRPMVASRWDVVEDLGIRGGARTYRAVNRTTKDEVSLRMLPSFVATDDRARESLSEAIGKQRSLQRMPGCVAAVSLEIEDKAAYVIEGIVRGRTLQERLKESPLPEKECLVLGAALADALAAAKAKGAAHGHIRPQTVLLGDDGAASLYGFGLEKVLVESTAREMGGGPTKATFYRSPEFRRSGLPDAASDQYALGCLLLEAATGDTRFPDPYNELSEDVRKGQAFPDPLMAHLGMDKCLANVIRRCAAPDPHDRFPDFGAVAAALRGGEFDRVPLLTLAEVAAMRAEKAAHAPPPPRRADEGKGAGNLVPAVIGAVVFLAGVGWYLQRERPKPPEPDTVAGVPDVAYIPAAPVLPDLLPPPAASLEGVVVPDRFEIRNGRVFSLMDGAEMVYIPPGPFPLGSEDGAEDEKPVRQVTLKGYLIDRHEVTVAQFRRFCGATGRTLPPQPGGSETFHPVVNITWIEANAFANWARKRLPTEAEWEKAARGAEGLLLPWGREDDPKRRNGPGDADGFPGLAPAGSFATGASPFGALDMLGNAFEWCNDGYAKDAYPTGPAGDPPGPAATATRVIRGWSFLLAPPRPAVTFRNHAEPDWRFEDLGFRCALSVK